MNRLSLFCGCLVASCSLINVSAAQESTDLPTLAGSESTTEVATEADIAERQTRVRQLEAQLREEKRQLRQSRRSQIEARLENLTEDERAALRERRKMQGQARHRPQR